MNEVVDTISKTDFDTQPRDEQNEDVYVQRIAASIPGLFSTQRDISILSDERHTDDEYGEEERQKKQRGGGGCSSDTCKKNDLLNDLQTVSDKTDGNISAVAQEAAEQVISHRQEFLLGITIHHAKYDKKSKGRWENKGRDMLDLFDPDEPGGERKDWYERLKAGMIGVKTGIIISPPTIYDELNYVQVYEDNGDHIDMYAIEHRGNLDDLRSLYKELATESTGVNENEIIDFSKPLFFQHEISFEHIADTIEQSFVTEESKSLSEDYLQRLHRDVANISLIDDYQREANELAQKIKQELLSRTDMQEGLAAIIWGLVAHANGEQQNQVSEPRDILRSTIDEVQRMAKQIAEETIHALESVHKVLVEKPETITNDYVDKQQKNEQVKSNPKQILKQLLHMAEYKQALRVLTSKQSDKEDDDNKMSWMKKAERMLGISKDQSLELLKQVSETHEAMEKAKDVVEFAVDTGVGIGAALFALESLATLDVISADTHEEFLPIEVPPILEKKDGQTVVTTQALEDIFIRIIKEPDIPSQEFDEPHQQIDIVVVGWLQEFIHTLDEKKSEEAIVLVEKEEEWVITKLEQLQEVLNLQGETLEPRIEIEQEAVQEFSLAVTAWMMLRLISYYEILNEIKGLLEQVEAGPKMTEKLIPKEPSPWLLLAIIWHLAMIREHGVTTTQKKKKQKKKKLYRSGLIYSHSVRDMINLP
jgi:hypothetical protein